MNEGLATDAVGDQPGGKGSGGAGDEADHEAGADEGDVVADGEQVEVQQHVERAVDHVHANYVDHVEVGVAAELPRFVAVVADEPGYRAA